MKKPVEKLGNSSSEIQKNTSIYAESRIQTRVTKFHHKKSYQLAKLNSHALEPNTLVIAYLSSLCTIQLVPEKLTNT